LADGAFGKLKETHAIEHNPYKHLSDKDLDKQIAELKARLHLIDDPSYQSSKLPAAETKPN